jgi:hypothetical protein
VIVFGVKIGILSSELKIKVNPFFDARLILLADLKLERFLKRFSPLINPIQCCHSE